MDIEAIAEKLGAEGINITSGYQGMRFVTHSGITRADIDDLMNMLKAFL